MSFVDKHVLVTESAPGNNVQIDRKTIYAYVQRGLIPYIRIESNVRFAKHQVARWLEERSFQTRPVNGKGAKRPQ